MHSECRLEFFPFIDDAHRFAPLLAQMRTLARQDAALPALYGQAPEVHAEFRAVRGPDGAWQPDRFYWCAQHAQPGASGLAARMLYWRARDGKQALYDFPKDPSLKSLGPALASLGGDGAAANIEVLRYVPLRRVTFRERHPDGSTRRIGKIKRASKIAESHARLADAHARATRRNASFRIARALDLDLQHNTFFQEALPGSNLARAAGAAGTALFERLGEVLQELHSLPADGMAPWALARYFATIEGDVEWIALFDPEAAARLRPVLDRLRRSCPGSAPDGHAFCHGDFLASQLLIDGDTCGVTDFDMARSGDPYQEIAKLIVSMRHDVPWIAAELAADEDAGLAHWHAAQDALLRGYQARAGRELDRERLAWFQACAEIHYLALVLGKDAWTSAFFARGMRSAKALGRKLR